jgi:hypothetical protein
MAYLNVRPISQGEIEFFAVTPDHFDGMATEPLAISGGVYIVAHSESGNDHVIDREKAEVSTVRDSAGMTVLRVLVTTPDTEVVNLNPHGHENLPLPPGIYEARISREMGMDDVIRDSRD